MEAARPFTTSYFDWPGGAGGLPPPCAWSGRSGTVAEFDAAEDAAGDAAGESATNTLADSPVLADTTIVQGQPSATVKSNW